jgi:uncharacterized protein (DUF2132 family)
VDRRAAGTLQEKQARNSSMSEHNLNGVTLEAIVTRLQDYYGWEQLAQRIDINCFISDPSVKSSLKFLRKTPWARSKVEALYLATKFTD